MSKTTTLLIGVAFASQLLTACASPQLVQYQLTELTPHRQAASVSQENYLPKFVVKESAKSRGERSPPKLADDIAAQLAHAFKPPVVLRRLVLYKLRYLRVR